jgi:hypothetical protein
MLRDGVAMHLPHARFICLSDVEVQCERIALLHNWPGWWSKLEFCRPDIAGDLLTLDLDTRIVGDMRDIAGIGRLALLSDFYRLSQAQSGIMFLPEIDRRATWRVWMMNPAQHMQRCGASGDGMFFREVLGARAARWQDALPGQIISYKVHVRAAQILGQEFGNGSVPEGARVICFHGKPRPWEVANV